MEKNTSTLEALHRKHPMGPNPFPRSSVTIAEAREAYERAIRIDETKKMLDKLFDRPDYAFAEQPPARRGPGRPPGKPRKKPPIQFCPVPGCRNRAAPVFHMVCGQHRKVSRRLIAKYRAERRASAKAKRGKGRAS